MRLKTELFAKDGKLVPDTTGGYPIAGPIRLSETDILAAADAIIERRFRRLGQLGSAAETKRFLRAKLIGAERELFGCLFFDHSHRIIAWEILFQGTINTCTVHPREVVKRALQHNCSGVVLAHQHPSGSAEPSGSDLQITRRLRDALALVDIKLLDHIVIGAVAETSLAERGSL